MTVRSRVIVDQNVSLALNTILNMQFSTINTLLPDWERDGYLAPESEPGYEL